MALTLEAEQRLQDAGLLKFFDKHQTVWLNAVTETYAFVKSNFPEGVKIRRDDVAKALRPILEVNEELRDELEESKLRGKLWITFFADLIIDRTWELITESTP